MSTQTQPATCTCLHAFARRACFHTPTIGSCMDLARMHRHGMDSHTHTQESASCMYMHLRQHDASRNFYMPAYYARHAAYFTQTDADPCIQCYALHVALTCAVLCYACSCYIHLVSHNAMLCMQLLHALSVSHERRSTIRWSDSVSIHLPLISTFSHTVSHMHQIRNITLRRNPNLTSEPADPSINGAISATGHLCTSMLSTCTSKSPSRIRPHCAAVLFGTKPCACGEMAQVQDERGQDSACNGSTTRGCAGKGKKRTRRRSNKQLAPTNDGIATRRRKRVRFENGEGMQVRERPSHARTHAHTHAPSL